MKEQQPTNEKKIPLEELARVYETLNKTSFPLITFELKIKPFTLIQKDKQELSNHYLGTKLSSSTNLSK